MFPGAFFATTRRYDEKTDMYSLGMLLFEMCHPPFGTKMERTVVLTNAHRLVFPTGDVWGPPKGQEAIKNLCRSMLQKESVARPSAADTVRQVSFGGWGEGRGGQCAFVSVFAFVCWYVCFCFVCGYRACLCIVACMCLCLKVARSLKPQSLDPF